MLTQLFCVTILVFLVRSVSTSVVSRRFKCFPGNRAPTFDSEIVAKSESQCSVLCAGTNGCKSVNFRPTAPLGTPNCQLTSFESKNLTADLHIDGDWTFLGVEVPPADCQDVQKMGFAESGTYQIAPNGVTVVTVVCDMQTEGGGWTIFQNRKDGAVQFNRTWAEYESGFGDFGLDTNFWFGLQWMNLITISGPSELYVHLKAPDGDTAIARYSTFMVEDASALYTLRIDGFSGSAGESMYKYARDEPFSTWDNDHGDQGCKFGSCSIGSGAGWWFSCCAYATLNGLYLNATVGYAQGMLWNSFKSLKISLWETRMMMRRV